MTQKNTRIFAHLNYNEIDVSLLDFEEYTNLYNKEIKFLRSKKWHRIPKSIKKSDLSSHHPVWRHEHKKDMVKELDLLISRIPFFIDNPSQIKYAYNISTTIETLINMKNELFSKIYGK